MPPTAPVNPYPPGQCTWWAAHEEPWSLAHGNLGNALDWGANWRERGGFVGMTPALGTIACFQPGADGADAVFGHVAVVIGGLTGRSFTVSEMNGPDGPGQTDDRTCTNGAGVAFLYPANPSPPPPLPVEDNAPMHLFNVADGPRTGYVMLFVESGAYLHVATPADISALEAAGATHTENITGEMDAVFLARYPS